MRDGDIRQALRAHLASEHAADPSTRFIDELDICGLARVDVAVVNGTLAGYELKSDVDTLRRLPHQVRTYSQVMDLLTLVVGEKHHDEAIELVPSWWGVILVRPKPIPTLELLREPQWNSDVVALSLAQLLWRDEVLAVLAARGIDRGVRSKPRRVLWNRLADEIPLDQMRMVVRECLKGREGWRSQEAHASSGA